MIAGVSDDLFDDGENGREDKAHEHDHAAKDHQQATVEIMHQ